MKKLLAKALAAMSAAAFLAPAAFAEKNVADVDFRTLPPDFENLPKREAAKWNFNFRPYGAEAASVLWSDPNTIRSVLIGGEADLKNLPTALYVSCDTNGLTLLVFGALDSSDKNLKNGNEQQSMALECFFLPGDADNPKIINYQPFGTKSIAPYFTYRLSWMKNDRNNRPLIPELKMDARAVSNGHVMRIFMPWTPMYDHLPFSDKKDNFWRLSLIRWDVPGGATWGGVVHQQIQPGYLRFPAFSPEQKTAIMKTVLMELWNKYQSVRNALDVNPAQVFGRDDVYRKETLEKYPHSYMNYNEDFGFRDAWLEPAIKERNALGADIADFEKMSPAEQDKFYRKASDLLANFRIDIESANAEYLKAKLMKR